jgi:indolepyruvate ferredoxin oxidoreductase beta subunit
VQASLRGFAAGRDALSKDSELVAPHSHRSGKSGPKSIDEVLRLGMARLLDFQDEAYAEQYRALVQGLADIEAPQTSVSIEAARQLALWMAYEDVIRVADLKSRRSRFEQIRRDYQAKPDEPVIVRDFLKPGVEEVAAILPATLARKLLAWANQSRRESFGEGVQLSTSSVTGLLAMRFLASLRFLRRRSSRFIAEQTLIRRWESALRQALKIERANQNASASGLSQAIASMPRLIKGYSDTLARGHGNFVRILEHVLEPGLASLAVPRMGAEGPGLTQLQQLADQLATAQKAALANPDGSELYRALGLQSPPLKEQVIKFARPISRVR